MPRFRHVPIVLVVVSLGHAGCAPAIPWPKMQTFDADGLKIAYFDEGQGEPVILIHGWLSSSGINWVLPGTSGQLAKNFRVVALDVRGHGQSDKPTEEEAYGPELVEDVVRLMDHLKIERAHIVGYSMGGLIAANFIAKHPERVRSGTLGGMGWMKDRGGAQWLFQQIGKKDKDAKALTVCGRSLAKLALTEDEIKSIRVPVTVLVGSNDRGIQGLYIDSLKKVRPDWPVVEIEGGTHITTIAKESFRDELTGWLKKQSAAEKSKSAPAGKNETPAGKTR
ncbi:MAG TPA: alpha/beta hydrolase [Pirellulales bacterium]|nr:alpha/beta hydrolase [Pirellulales bacterium]